MSFRDVRFPVRVSMGASGGPGFVTNIAIMESGQESRNQEWEFERGEWEVSQAAKLPDDYKPLQAFFRLVAGMAYSFRFKDWTDFECAAGEGFFTDADGSPSGKQMVKRYTFGGFTIDRKITKPVSGTITWSGGGTLNYATGIVEGAGTGQGSPPDTWSGEFDVCARFDTDKMRAAAVSRNPGEGLIVSWESIPIVEVKDE